MPNYTAKQKALVVELIKRNGGVVNNEVIKAARDLLNANVTRKTLYNWWTSRQDYTEVTQVKKQTVSREWVTDTLDNYFEKIAYTYLDHAVKDEVVKKTSGNQAVMTAAVAVDKMRLLRNLPTEIVGILPGLMTSIRDAGHDPVQFFTLLQTKLDNQKALNGDDASGHPSVH